MNSNIGVVGLSVMGMNLALNMADNGYRVSIFNRTISVVDKVMEENFHKNFTSTYSLKEFVKSLEKPRRIFLMVKSGKPVDMLIEQLIDIVEEGDIIIDGGNSFYKDTIRRTNYLKEKNINFLGVGISGGEEGARFGPAIMPGGTEEAYKYVKDIFEDISAKAYGESCCKYISEDGSGHYVKMVHNGIEYADMQLISEAYAILKNIGGLNNHEIQKVFEDWNKSELESYLIEITANIFKVKEDDGTYLLDNIMDKASQKGTGKWTNLEAIDLGVDISVISAALNARFMSNLKDERTKAENIIFKNTVGNNQDLNINLNMDRKELIKLVKNSLYISKIVSYAQGFKLLKAAEKEYSWNLNFSEIAKIFRGGCIIRAKFLNDISDAFVAESDVDNLILTKFFSNEINTGLEDLRRLLSITVQQGVPVSAMSSALGYIDTYRTSRSSANLIQAQRDYFGAHTFERLDREGSFHYEWIENNEK
ncbi:NADP-dependent phosphogluconate dehydrogenase [Peptostreptococcus canis]|uniref:6-phosphogluconate dehydrogenase, decarboxylating n=1 Tax=Peptostreptococcus canis TaxID=1159213 RepID=A0ABR6TIC7_9FIRM|nr:NADP-dependent phosphogluconate dehydrogenase [Peptostreptococcus canis]MBC2575177.1 NADP-dependent phosphogluconate dehydrogenase [Peptostreptococcus canis]MBP1997648.1 6-phosphogluconate dehydrogenase [Peptostreptococcus canis]